MQEIQKLIDGFKGFQNGYFKDNAATFNTLIKEGQSPKIALIACSDSRVDPAVVLNVEPGHVFMVRNVANLVPPYETDGKYHGTSAALEYAVTGLNVDHIIILGHAHCGGIYSLLDGDVSEENETSFVKNWMTLANAAKRRVEATMPDAPPKVKQRHCEQGSVLVSLENLMTFPWVRQKVEAKELRLHGWYVDIEKGELFAYDSAVGNFTKLG